MRKYWRKVRPSLYYAMLHAGEKVRFRDGTEKLTKRGEKCQKIMKRLGSWERHIPIHAEALAGWNRELPYYGNSSYAAILRRDIRLAEECNQHGDEMLISLSNRSIVNKENTP